MPHAGRGNVNRPVTMSAAGLYSAGLGIGTRLKPAAAFPAPLVMNASLAFTPVYKPAFVPLIIGIARDHRIIPARQR